jgi:NADH-quinone oxidoreductase subunit A
VAAAFAFGTLIFSALVGKKGHRSKIKDTAYECGMLPIGAGSARFSVKFYLVAMLFILFDVEVVFLFPWAVVYKEMLAEACSPDLWFNDDFLGLFLVGFHLRNQKEGLRLEVITDSSKYFLQSF